MPYTNCRFTCLRGRMAFATLLLLFSLPVWAQRTDTLSPIITNEVKYVTDIGFKELLALVPETEKMSDVADSLFTSNNKDKLSVTSKMVDHKKAIIVFKLLNQSDSVNSLYFFPGHQYKAYHVYKKENNRYEPLPVIMPPIRDSIGYRLIRVPPGDSMTMAVELYFEKTYTNYLWPRLIAPDYLDNFITNMRHSKEQLDVMTFIFCGILLMMIFFSLASYIMNGATEFLYYSLYALFLGTMLFTKTIFSGMATRFAFFFESYFDFVLQSFGVIFYMLFMKFFLETRRYFRFLQVFYNAGIIFLLVSTGIYSYLHFFTSGYIPEFTIESLSKFVLLAMVIVFIGYGIRHWDNKLLRFLVWGNLALFIFSLFSQLMISLRIRFFSLPVIFNSSLFYYELGLVAELIFFLVGLNYKNRQQLIRQTKERERLRSENQLKEADKKLAVFKAQQEERNRISLDMHDELGAGMTAIRLMSEIAKKKMGDDVPREIDRISHSANDLLNKMNAIIWSMNNRNDTVDNLVSYIRTYAMEYFENTGLHLRISTPEKILHAELIGDKRRNIFLCVKETITNIIKHSHATEVFIEIECEEHLIIRIHDNGIGIDLENIRKFGNGLRNIEKRMHNIDGSFQIENKEGTVTTLTLPLHC